MSSTKRDRAIARSSIAVGAAALVTGIVLAVAAGARAKSKPAGPLPPGPTATITTAHVPPPAQVWSGGLRGAMTLRK